MADYFMLSVIQPSIPIADMTPLERLLLAHIFTAEPDEDGLYFYAEECPSDMIFIARDALETALAESRHDEPSEARRFVAERLAQCDPAESEIDLDVSGTSWAFFIQDIVRRSQTLHYVSVTSSFTCSRMRPDGFGGMAMLITADRILAKSTTDLIEDFLTETGFGEDDTPLT